MRKRKKVKQRKNRLKANEEMTGRVTNRRRTDKTIVVKAKPFKRKFDSLLRHIKVILIQKRETLPTEIWYQLVHEARMSVVHHPADYLGPQLPDKKIAREAIHLVFDGFLHDLHIREVQSFRKY